MYQYGGTSMKLRFVGQINVVGAMAMAYKYFSQSSARENQLAWRRRGVNNIWAIIIFKST
jgi:hypothetical protein